MIPASGYLKNEGHMSQTTYPFDPLRSNAACVVKETLAQPTNAKRVLFPTAAPFYQKGFTVTDNGRPMVEGIDFYFTHRYVTGTHQTAQRIYGSIWIVNPDCVGPYALTYNTLGGNYLIDATRRAAYIATMGHPNTDYWEQVMGEDRFFPPVDIQFDRDAFIWEPQLIEAIDNVATAIANKDEHKNALSQLISCIADISDKDMIASVWNAHLHSTGVKHGETHFDAGALHKNGIAQNTLSFESMDLTQITDYILGALDFSWITVDKFPLMEKRRLLGAMYLRDNLACLSYRNPAGKLVPVITFDKGIFTAMVPNNVLINGDIDSNGGDVRIIVGNNTLRVNGSGNAQDDSQITLNGVPFITTDTLYSSPAFASQVDAPDVSYANNSDVSFSGTGKTDSPLSATANFPIASDVALGLAKLSQVGDVSRGVGISQKAVTDLRDEIADLLPDTRTINGKRLNANVPFTAADIGLAYAPNVSDANYPASIQHVDALAGKSPANHTHEFSAVTLPIADTTKFGITELGNTETNPTGSALDGGTASSFLSDVDQGAYSVDDMLPNGALEMVRYSPDGYISAPVNGLFLGTGQNPTYPTFYGEFENDGTFVFLRNGLDVDGSGVFYSSCTFNEDGSIADIVPTSVAYTPNGLSGETAIAALSGNNGCFLLKTSAGYRIVVTDGTMRVSHHHSCLIANVGLTIPVDTLTAIVGDEVWLVIPTFTASYARFQIYTVKLATVMASTEVTLTAKAMTGPDLYTVGQTATTTFRFASSVITTTGSQSLLMASDTLATTVINSHGTTIALEQQGDYVRLMFEITYYAWTADDALKTAYPLRVATFQLGATVNRLTNAVVAKTNVQLPVSVTRTQIGDGVRPTVSQLAAPSLPLSNAYLCRNRDRVMALATNQNAASIYPVVYNGDSVSPDYYDQIDVDTVKFKMLGNGVPCMGPHADALAGPMYGWGELGGKQAFVKRSNHNPILVTYDTTSDYATPGLGAVSRTDLTNEQVDQFANMLYVGSSETIAGCVVNSKTGLAYSTLSGTTPGGQVTVTAAAFLSVNAAVKAMNLFTVDWLIEEYGELIIPTDPTLPAVYLYSWLQWDDSTKTRKEAHNRMFDVTLANRTGVISQITLGAGYGGASMINAVVDVSYPTSFLGNWQIGTLDDGNLVYIMNSRFTANRSRQPQSTSRIAIYNPTAKAWQYTSVITVTDQVPSGWCYNKTLGAFVLSGSTNREELYAMVRGKTMATIKTGTTTQNILQFEKPANPWLVSFTEKVFGYMNGRGVLYPVKSIDLSKVTASYKSRTFYLYATSASAGVGDYTASLTLLDDTASRILIGTVVTGNYGIVALQCNARTRLLSFRELEDHAANHIVHGFEEFTKSNIGLSKVANKPAQSALVYPTPASQYANWWIFTHQPTDPYFVLNAIWDGWSYSGSNWSRSTLSSKFTGVVSDKAVGDYTLSACFTTTDATKTETALVLAMFDDGNEQHTLTLVRSNSDLDRGVGDTESYRRCGVYYDYGLPTCKLIKLIYNDGPIADAVDLNWRVKAVRSGDMFTVYTSPIISGSLPGKGNTVATGTFTLNDLPELAIFKDTNRYGYAVRGGRVSITVENDAYSDPLNNYATVAAVYDELYWGANVTLSGVTTDTGTVPLPAGHSASDTFTVLVPFSKPTNTTGSPIKSFLVKMDDATRKVTALATLANGVTKAIPVEYYVMVLPKARSYT